MRSQPLFATLALALASLSAHADTISTFNLSATIDSNSDAGGVLSGTILIDTTLGTVVSSDLKNTSGSKTYTVSSTVTHSGTLGNGSAYDLTFGTIGDPSDAFLSLVFPATSLIDFTGAALCREGAPCSQAGSNYTSSYFAPGSQFGDGLSSGFLSFVAPPPPPTPVSVTPEPAGLSLLATGLLAGAGALGRKRRIAGGHK